MNCHFDEFCYLPTKGNYITKMNIIPPFRKKQKNYLAPLHQEKYLTHQIYLKMSYCNIEKGNNCIANSKFKQMNKKY